MPVYVHVIDHPDGRVLVDTGMTELHPAVADMDPRLSPLSEQDFDLAGIDIVVNTHLHFDHCGGNHLFAGKPIYVQRRELEDARSQDDYTIREWVDAPGVEYVPVDGELELLPGVRLVPAPGHTPGTQVVVVETGGRPIVIAGDMAVWFGELDEPQTEGQRLVRALDPELVWLAHVRRAVATPNRLRRCAAVGSRARVLARGSGGLTRALGDLTLVSRECGQDLALLGGRNVELVERLREDGGDGIELGGLDVQVAVGFLEAQAVSSGRGAHVALRATGDAAEPERPHELQAGQAPQILGVPGAKRGVVGYPDRRSDR